MIAIVNKIDRSIFIDNIFRKFCSSGNHIFVKSLIKNIL